MNQVFFIRFLESSLKLSSSFIGFRFRCIGFAFASSDFAFATAILINLSDSRFSSLLLLSSSLMSFVFSLYSDCSLFFKSCIFDRSLFIFRISRETFSRPLSVSFEFSRDFEVVLLLLRVGCDWTWSAVFVFFDVSDSVSLQYLTI